MSTTPVSNPSSSSSVIVAHRTIKPSSTANIPTKDLDRWLEKGGQRLLESGIITIGVKGDAVLSIKTGAEPEGDADTGMTFDGKPVETTQPESGFVEGPSISLDPLSTPEGAAAALELSQSTGNEGEVEDSVDEEDATDEPDEVNAVDAEKKPKSKANPKKK